MREGTIAQCHREVDRRVSRKRRSGQKYQVRGKKVSRVGVRNPDVRWRSVQEGIREEMAECPMSGR